EESVAQCGTRPLHRLEALGQLRPRQLGVHMTQLEDTEIEQYASRGAHVVHCAESNLKLASGFCAVEKLARAGINVALGTDSAASNNDLDMLAEMRSAALLAKAVAADASAVPAAAVLRMATINAARALGLDEQIGSIEPGKAADLVAVDLGGVETQPVYNPVSQLVYAAARDKVSDVWVAGRHLLKDKELTTLDTDELLEKTKDWGGKIAAWHNARGNQGYE
ncbi:MAG: amidohydrolase family protein, partial [Pseudomonadota bacterium]